MTGVYQQYFVAIVYEVVVADVGRDVSLCSGSYGRGYKLAAATAAQCDTRYAYFVVTEAVARDFHAFASEG